MTLGVIGKKVGMTQIFDEQGLAIPVTVIKVDETVVTQVKTVETDPVACCIQRVPPAHAEEAFFQRCLQSVKAVFPKFHGGGGPVPDQFCRGTGRDFSGGIE